MGTASRMGLFACLPDFDSDVRAREADAVRWLKAIEPTRRVPEEPEPPVIGMNLAESWEYLDVLVAAAVACERGDTGLAWPPGVSSDRRGLEPVSSVQAKVSRAGVSLLLREDLEEACEFLWQVRDLRKPPVDAAEIETVARAVAAFLDQVEDRELRLYCALGT